MKPLLDIRNLSVDFVAEDAITIAIRNISFTINRGEVVAIVGESGSGKTVTALSILKLLPSPPAKYRSGKILFSEDGSTVENLQKKTHAELKNIRGNRIAMIFQEPMSSLNPVFFCGHQVMEAVLAHKKISTQQARQETIEWFTKVKLPDPEKIFHRYPHQLSGGQKQRVMIAMAMCCHPSLLICDEPTTALDVTVQKSILQLIHDLQKEQNIGVIFITHDLGIVAEVADKVIVMYKGDIVEQNPVKEIFNSPQHPYTKALLACRPVNHQRGERLPVVTDFLREDQLGVTSYEPGDKKPETRNPQSITSIEKPETLLEVENLSVWFPVKKNLFGKPLEFIKAVDNVSFQVFKGEILGLVGESGCGKTTLGRALLRLVKLTSGKIVYNGIDLTAERGAELKSFRKEIQ